MKRLAVPKVRRCLEEPSALHYYGPGSMATTFAEMVRTFQAAPPL